MKIVTTDNVTKQLDGINDRLSRINSDLSRESAEWVCRELKRTIIRQTIEFAPRSPKTKSPDPRILIETMDYVNGMHVIKDGNDFAVACDRQKRFFAEYGRSGQPERPHWQPVMEKFRKYGYQEVIKKVMR